MIIPKYIANYVLLCKETRITSHPARWTLDHLIKLGGIYNVRNFNHAFLKSLFENKNFHRNSDERKLACISSNFYIFFYFVAIT